VRGIAISPERFTLKGQGQIFVLDITKTQLINPGDKRLFYYIVSEFSELIIN
jgi:hypothetical protein